MISQRWRTPYVRLPRTCLVSLDLNSFDHLTTRQLRKRIAVIVDHNMTQQSDGKWYLSPTVVPVLIRLAAEIDKREVACLST